MDEMQLNEILSSYRDAINALIERIDAQDEMVKATVEKVDGLNHLIFDEVINPAKQAMDEEIYNAGLNDFSGRWGEKLEGYNDKLRPIEGEDFDIMKQAYDGYNSIEGEKPEEGMYIDELVKVVDEQLDAIRNAIGAPEDSEVTVEDNGEGEPVVMVDGEPVTEAPAEGKAEGDGDVIVEDAVGDGIDEVESDPEELAKLEEELEEYAKK